MSCWQREANNTNFLYITGKEDVGCITSSFLFGNKKNAPSIGGAVSIWGKEGLDRLKELAEGFCCIPKKEGYAFFAGVEGVVDASVTGL